MAVTLLITATGLEAAPLKRALPWTPQPFALGELFVLPERNLYLAHLGVAKVNTAAGFALAISTLEPGKVVQLGIAGAFAGAGLELCQVAVATQETHMDTGVQLETEWQDMAALGFPLTAGHFNTFRTDADLTRALADLTGATPCPFGTSETVTGSFARAEKLFGRFGISTESMEGAAAAQVCTALGVPFAELRGVSNIVGERDKANWRLRGAVETVNDAVLTYLRVMHSEANGKSGS